MKTLVLFLFVFSVAFRSNTMASPQAAKVNSHKIDVPSKRGATTPFLLKDGPAFWMSWQEPVPNLKSGEEKIWRLQVAKFENGKWSSPATVIESSRLMISWADFPSLQKDPQGHLYVTWLENSSSSNAHGYFANISKSTDQGKTWKHLGVLHQDKNQNAEHGFISMLTDQQGVRVFWLDGGQMKTHQDATQLRTAEVFQEIKNEMLVDEKTCSCCGTVAVEMTSGPLIFYRDRSDKEIRDISVARKDGQSWKNNEVSRDGWKIQGCPVNGPNADSDGQNIALAWYSGGGSRPGVKLIFSNNSGKSFSKGIEVDDFLENSLGRVEVVLLNSEEAAVFWMKSTADGKGDIYARKVHRDGRRGLPVKIVETESTRSVGFPQVQKIEDQFFVVWTDSGQEKHKPQGLKMVRLSSSEIPVIGEKDNPPTQLMTSGSSSSKSISSFTATDIDGKNVELAHFKGKTVLLNFWASWCDACIEEFDLINKLEKKYSANGLKIITVNVDETSAWPKALKLIKQSKLSSTVWRNNADQAIGQFGFSALPYTILLDSELKIKDSFTGSLIGKEKLLETQISRLLK